MKTVDAVKSVAEIDRVEQALLHRHGQIYADIWRVGVNMALRISDLLAIRYDELDLIEREYLLVEGKTRKPRAIRLNAKALEIIKRRRTQYPEDIYLFQVHSNRQRDKPIHRVTVGKVFKEVGDKLEINLGTHSTRKTRGWAMHQAGVPIEKIAKVLNHSSPAVTMRYLGITRAEVLDTYDEFEL